MEARMDHIVLNMENDEAMITFYTEVMEFSPERLAAYYAGEVPFPSVRLNKDTIIDLFPRRMWSKDKNITGCQGHLNHFCVALEKDDWEKLQERLVRHGITVEEGPVLRWGAHGTGTSVYFRDPENNLIEARYYEVAGSSDQCLLGS
ncbi:VOC family protein [Desulfogranum japonicum]|uniref:VOC family protein n=1 Tax=Desulfogranum japonicum TaxID=231447 RepID=UPI0003FD0A92|nr:VOC family protein [Desulfogranum japonicum]